MQPNFEVSPRHPHHSGGEPADQKVVVGRRKQIRQASCDRAYAQDDKKEGIGYISERVWNQSQ